MPLVFSMVKTTSSRLGPGHGVLGTHAYALNRKL